MGLLNGVSWATTGQAMAGDQNPGTGLTTGTRTVTSAVANANDIVGVDVAPQMKGTTTGHPVSWWIAIIAVLIVIKYLAESSGEASDYSNIRIGFLSIIVITLSAVVGMIFLKWVAGLYRIPGFSDIILAS